MLVHVEPLNGVGIAAAPDVPRGVPGERLADFAGTIRAGDLAAMREAIRDRCERVDADGW